MTFVPWGLLGWAVRSSELVGGAGVRVVWTNGLLQLFGGRQESGTSGCCLALRLKGLAQIEVCTADITGECSWLSGDLKQCRSTRCVRFSLNGLSGHALNRGTAKQYDRKNIAALSFGFDRGFKDRYCLIRELQRLLRISFFRRQHCL